MIAGEAGIAPSFNDILANLPQHQNFYIRGMLNALRPSFMPAGKRMITEDDVSGEYLETLRLVANRYASNLKEGQSIGLGYEAVRNVFGVKGDYYKNYEADTMADMVNNTLGRFNIKRENGQLIVDHDVYDFPPEFEQSFSKKTGKSPSLFDYLQQGMSLYQQYGLSGEGIHKMAHLGGEYFMAEDNPDNLRARIVIPDNPPVIDVDFDDDIPEGAQEMVLRGPMTNKRKQIFDNFLDLFSMEAQAAQDSMTLPKSKPTQEERIAAQPSMPIPTSKPSMLERRMDAADNQDYSNEMA